MISPLASVHSNAKIGNNVTIDPFTMIHDEVHIGEGTWVGSNVTLMRGARIGKNCKIFPGAVIGAIPQDLKFEGECTTAEIGDNCTIREFVTVNRGTKASGKTIIGRNCLLMAYAHVAHDCVIGDNVILANGVNLAGHVEIEDHAILEGIVAVQQFVRIGTQAFITGGSLVRKNVPPYVKAAREPLAYAGINAVGLRRRKFSDEVIRNIEDTYRILYVRENNVSRAIGMIQKEIPATDERDKIIDFIINSPKGIMKGYGEAETEEEQVG
jgi:UDP-N-acetylglucosamine acyltransferase